MREEEEHSILQKKFREWFGKTVPVALPFPDETDRSIGDSVPADLPFPAETVHSLGDPVPANRPLPAKTDYLNHKTRKRNVDNSSKLLELLSFGFGGAVSLGAVVGVIIIILNLSFLGWYSNNWPNQFFVIFLAMVLGFYIGLSKGYISQQREKYFYKGELWLTKPRLD
jgi:hypothetical protein